MIADLLFLFFFSFPPLFFPFPPLFFPFPPSSFLLPPLLSFPPSSLLFPLLFSLFPTLLPPFSLRKGPSTRTQIGNIFSKLDSGLGALWAPNVAPAYCFARHWFFSLHWYSLSAMRKKCFSKSPLLRTAARPPSKKNHLSTAERPKGKYFGDFFLKGGGLHKAALLRG